MTTTIATEVKVKGITYHIVLKDYPIPTCAAKDVKAVIAELRSR